MIQRRWLRCDFDFVSLVSMGVHTPGASPVCRGFSSEGTRIVTGRFDSLQKGGETMLGWAVTFLIIAIIAAVLGFGGIAAASAGIAKFLFFLFLVMFLIFALFGWRGRGVS
jgi:uncharacterized membrane protein YtjA (UPF0391 family)